MPLLEIHRLTKSFGRMVAVDQVDLTIATGQLTAVIGPNGAGKTTLFNVITGKLQPTMGRVTFRGEDITGFSPYAIVSRGIARSFQVTNVFPELTVADNLRVAVLSARRYAGRHGWRGGSGGATAEVARLLQELGLQPHAELPCAVLSHAHQRLVEIGLALGGHPRLLLLDEPTAGMGLAETVAMTHFIRNLAQREELTVALIEHDMQVVFALAERVVVMHQGRIIADGAPAVVRDDPLVRAAYLGQ
jgi:branched-chain amino acid transport system ATP-binding protein